VALHRLSDVRRWCLPARLVRSADCQSSASDHAAARCLAVHPNSDICLLLNWSRSGGTVAGYHIYVGRTGGACGPQDSTCTLPDWCVDGNRNGVTPAATAPPGATSYDLPLTGEYPPPCVAVSAFNAAGESPWTVAEVGPREPVAP